jgi:hypothetical protein
MNLNRPTIHTRAGLSCADFDGHCQPAEACTDMGDNPDDEAWRCKIGSIDRVLERLFWRAYAWLVAALATTVVALWVVLS